MGPRSAAELPEADRRQRAQVFPARRVTRVGKGATGRAKPAASHDRLLNERAARVLGHGGSFRRIIAALGPRRNISQKAARQLPNRAAPIKGARKCPVTTTPRAGGSRHRKKGDRTEREIVQLHRSIGVHAERYPLSGASRFRDSGHDLDLYIDGRDAAPSIAEV